MANPNKRRHTQLIYGSQQDEYDPLPQSTAGPSITNRSPPTSALHLKASPPLPRQTIKSREPWAESPKLFLQQSTKVCRGTVYRQLHVAVKERKTKEDLLGCLVTFHHAHISRLFDVYYFSGTAYLIYEYMEVSLKSIASLKSRLSCHEIGLVVKAVCNGLQFIHEELKISHGNLSCRNVLVNRNGDIKISNVGDSLLAQTSLKGASKDIRSIGLIMVELMEQATSVLNPDSLKIVNPDLWTDDPRILQFLADTDTNSLDELLKHPFIPRDSDYATFSTQVLLAQMNTYIKNKMLDEA